MNHLLFDVADNGLNIKTTCWKKFASLKKPSPCVSFLNTYNFGDDFHCRRMSLNYCKNINNLGKNGNSIDCCECNQIRFMLQCWKISELYWMFTSNMNLINLFIVFAVFFKNNINVILDPAKKKVHRTALSYSYAKYVKEKLLFLINIFQIIKINFLWTKIIGYKKFYTFS